MTSKTYIIKKKISQPMLDIDKQLDKKYKTTKEKGDEYENYILEYLFETIPNYNLLFNIKIISNFYFSIS